MTYDETKARQERRERRFRCIADPTVKNLRRELRSKAKQMREEERQARKWNRDGQAEEYREAGNAIENAVAELESYFDTNSVPPGDADE